MTLTDDQKKKTDYNYHLDGDALYERYRDLYTQNAKRSMQDTIGQASALTGGYGSTYAQSQGQQTYDNTMRTLVTDIVPDLEETAYNRQQTAYSNLTSLIQMGYYPSDTELQSAGMSRNVADLLAAKYSTTSTSGSSGGSYSGTGGTGTGGTGSSGGSTIAWQTASPELRREYQDYLNTVKGTTGTQYDWRGIPIVYSPDAVQSESSSKGIAHGITTKKKKK